MSEREALLEKLVPAVAQALKAPACQWVDTPTIAQATTAALDAIEEDHLIIPKSAEAIAELAKPLEWVDESVRWGRPTYKAKGLPIVLRKSSEILRWEFVTEYTTHFISVNEADFDEAVIAADKHYRAELAKHFDREGE